MLRDIPKMLVREHYDKLMTLIHQEAKLLNDKSLSDWLEHKKNNPWVLECINLGTSEMTHEDWFTTSHDTNIAESAHAQSQLDGVKMTLVSAIQKGMRFDSRFLEAATAMSNKGISVKYGNNSLTGRAKKNIVRKQKSIKKKEKANDIHSESGELVILQDMIRSGVSPDVIEKYLTFKTSGSK